MPTPHPSKREVLSVQVLRGLAAWLVVLQHNDYRPDSPIARLIGDRGSFGVDVFFTISGFVMVYVRATRNDGAVSFALNRLLRILPAYWAATLLMVLAKAAFPVAFGYTDWNPLSLLQSLLFIPSDNPSGLGVYPLLTVGWTLNIEIFFYLCLALMLGLNRRRAFALCAVVLCVAPVVWDKAWPYASVLASRKLYEFVFGMALGHVYTALPALRERLQRSHAIPLLLVGVSAACMWLDRTGMRSLAAGGLVAAGLCWETRFFDPERAWVRALRWLGKVSYSTYVLHLLVIGLLAQWFGDPTSTAEELGRLLLLSVLVIGASYLGFRYIEDGAHVRLLRSLMQRRAAAPVPPDAAASSVQPAQ